MNEIQTYIKKIVTKHHLSEGEAARAFQIIMSGGATPAQIASFITALTMKGETIDEITGAARSLRARSATIMAPTGTIDTCGTGGDQAGTLNISTAVAIVVAACGVPVAKHGNKAVSSRSGSADVLKELGINIEASPAIMQDCLNTHHLCFLYAPQFHQALRHIGPIRLELGFRTIFNLLGPLCSPANTSYHVLGVYDINLVDPIAHVLDRLGCKRAWVVHGYGGLEYGLDELTITGKSRVCEVDNGQFRTFDISPEDAGLPSSPLDSILGGSAHDNAKAMLALLKGASSPYRDIVLFNSAAALLVAGKVGDLTEGVVLAQDAIITGKALYTLQSLISCTHEAHS
ncbi:MAG: anthranilate phosphoribosyltransferase [Alphaproteobacteria bacterium]|nr:anthranilate phosphoribosyltransferase [Alphaproteobacteria bacterium]